MRPFKVAIGMKIREGPWGGGNQFGKSMYRFLREKGCTVINNLSDSDIDLIVLTEPRKGLQSSAFDDKDILRYLIFKNPKTIIVHRINECDERKGTIGVNRRLIQANYVADNTIYISSWLKDLFKRHGIEDKPYSVILNGGDINIFNKKGISVRSSREKLKLVTHHWGAGYLKGFDIYIRMDNLLDYSTYRNKFEFTYIGNVSDGVEFKNTKCIPPKSGEELATELKKSHVYLTASQNEPAGMHHIEGALCGLPLLYRESGALPEYCKGYGIRFTSKNFEKKLNEILEQYNSLKKKMDLYPYTSEKMCTDYYNLLVRLLENREDIIKRRRLYRKPLYVLKKLLIKTRK